MQPWGGLLSCTMAPGKGDSVVLMSGVVGLGRLLEHALTQQRRQGLYAQGPDRRMRVLTRGAGTGTGLGLVDEGLYRGAARVLIGFNAATGRSSHGCISMR